MYDTSVLFNNDEIKFRILENFHDGKLETLKYMTRSGSNDFVQSGPLESLIDALIFPLNQGICIFISHNYLMRSNLDDTYAEVFLATYRFFVPASEVLTSLIEWFNIEIDDRNCTYEQEVYFKKNKKLFQTRSIKTLTLWIKNHWHDFHSDDNLLLELLSFINDVSNINFGDGQRLTHAIREQVIYT